MPALRAVGEAAVGDVARHVHGRHVILGRPVGPGQRERLAARGNPEVRVMPGALRVDEMRRRHRRLDGAVGELPAHAEVVVAPPLLFHQRHDGIAAPFFEVDQRRRLGGVLGPLAPAGRAGDAGDDGGVGRVLVRAEAQLGAVVAGNPEPVGSRGRGDEHAAQALAVVVVCPPVVRHLEKIRDDGARRRDECKQRVPCETLDGGAGNRPPEVADDSGQLFARGTVLAGGPDEQVFSGADCGVRWEAPLERVRVAVGQPPAREVHGRCSGVEQLDPVLVVVLLVGEGRPIGGHELVDHHLAGGERCERQQSCEPGRKESVMDVGCHGFPE